MADGLLPLLRIVIVRRMRVCSAGSNGYYKESQEYFYLHGLSILFCLSGKGTIPFLNIKRQFLYFLHFIGIDNEGDTALYIRLYIGNSWFNLILFANLYDVTNLK